MMTDFRLLVFVTTARVLSFTRAAEELNVSQPAVTKHIKELERLLSTPLFRRSGNRIALTSGAEALLPLAKAVLDRYRDLREGMLCENHEMSGRLRLGASTTIAQYILPEILARFKREHQQIEVSLMSGNSESILKAVEQESIDLALIEDAHTAPMFHYEHFAEDRVLLVTANGKKRRIRIEEMVELPLVLRENGSGTLEVVERELAKHRISRRALKVVMQIASSEGIVRYLSASECYALISESAVRDRIERGELQVCEIEGVCFERELRFATLHGVTNRLVEGFKEFYDN